MKKKKHQFIGFICDKCGKDMPKDEEKSDENWTVVSPDCPCGGKSKLKFAP
jgi:hypothetical protein